MHKEKKSNASPPIPNTDIDIYALTITKIKKKHGRDERML